MPSKKSNVTLESLMGKSLANTVSEIQESKKQSEGKAEKPSIQQGAKTTIIENALEHFNDIWGPVRDAIRTANRLGLKIIDPLDPEATSNPEVEKLRSFALLLQETGEARTVVKSDLHQHFLECAHTALTGIAAESEQFRKNWEEKKKGWLAVRDADNKRMVINHTAYQRIKNAVDTGKHVMLLGEPGTAKTSLANAMAHITHRKLFKLNVSGMSDVSQMESERIIKSVNGAPESVFIKSQLIEALEAAMRGEKVILRIDEIPRVSDNTILNPLMELLSHGSYVSTVFEQEYKVSRENFVVIATANFDPGFNFSGNNRKGLDDALRDRFRRVRLERIEPKYLKPVLQDAVKGITDDMVEQLTDLYSLAKTDEQKRLITVRSIIDIADEWAGLNPDLYSLKEVVYENLRADCREPDVLTALIGALESKKSK